MLHVYFSRREFNFAENSLNLLVDLFCAFICSEKKRTDYELISNLSGKSFVTQCSPWLIKPGWISSNISIVNSFSNDFGFSIIWSRKREQKKRISNRIEEKKLIKHKNRMKRFFKKLLSSTFIIPADRKVLFFFFLFSIAILFSQN